MTTYLHKYKCITSITLRSCHNDYSALIELCRYSFEYTQRTHCRYTYMHTHEQKCQAAAQIRSTCSMLTHFFVVMNREHSLNIIGNATDGEVSLIRVPNEYA